MTNRVVITWAKRTPIGKFKGVFQHLYARDLAVSIVKALVKETAIPVGEVHSLILGNARQAGSGPNPARQVACLAGLPIEVPAYTINMACGSGLKALAMAYEEIATGRSECVIAAGTESMTNVPFLFDKLRLGYKLGNVTLHDGMYRDGFLDPICGLLMGQTAENLSQKYAISREEQDIYALESYRRAQEAIESGRFREELIPVETGQHREKKGSSAETELQKADEYLRKDVRLEDLAKLPPVFKEDGTVTAGNACGITDAAAACLVVNEQKAREWNLPILAQIQDYAACGVDPAFMGIGAAQAVKVLEKRTGVKLADYDLVEMNEAFAAQVLSCAREMPFDFGRTNVNGGAVALGHPIGATGIRIVVTLLHEMAKRQVHKGLATLCISGGQGFAMNFQRPS